MGLYIGWIPIVLLIISVRTFKYKYQREHAGDARTEKSVSGPVLIKIYEKSRV
jgi:hypothetical protein